MDKDTTEEADKALCKANPEKLFKEVVTEIVDQRMKKGGQRKQRSSWLAKESHG